MKRLYAIAALPIVVGAALIFDNIIRSMRLFSSQHFEGIDQLLQMQIAFEMVFVALVLLMAWLAIRPDKSFVVPIVYLVVSGLVLMYVLGLVTPLFNLFHEFVRQNGDVLKPFLDIPSPANLAVLSIVFSFVIGLAALGSSLYARTSHAKQIPNPVPA
jgi:hypothetical protein